MKASIRKITYIAYIVLVSIALIYPAMAHSIVWIVMSHYPNNNPETGCPNGLHKCPIEEKMLCYRGHVFKCYLVALPGLLLFTVFAISWYLFTDWLASREHSVKDRARSYV